MPRSTVGEQAGFLPDADAVDAMKIAFFTGAFVAYYKLLEATDKTVDGIPKAVSSFEDQIYHPKKPYMTLGNYPMYFTPNPGYYVDMVKNRKLPGGK